MVDHFVSTKLLAKFDVCSRARRDNLSTQGLGKLDAPGPYPTTSAVYEDLCAGSEGASRHEGLVSRGRGCAYRRCVIRVDSLWQRCDVHHGNHDKLAKGASLVDHGISAQNELSLFEGGVSPVFANNATAEIHTGSRRASDHHAAYEWCDRKLDVDGIERCADYFDKELVFEQGRDAGDGGVVFETHAVF